MLQARVPPQEQLPGFPCRSSGKDSTLPGMGSVPGQGTEILHAMGRAKKKKKAAAVIPKQERQACRHTDTGLKPDSGTSGISLLVILHKMDMPRSISQFLPRLRYF